jgi:hypothetical protein
VLPFEFERGIAFDAIKVAPISVFWHACCINRRRELARATERPFNHCATNNPMRPRLQSLVSCQINYPQERSYSRFREVGRSVAASRCSRARILGPRRHRTHRRCPASGYSESPPGNARPQGTGRSLQKYSCSTVWRYWDSQHWFGTSNRSRSGCNMDHRRYSYSARR